MDDVTTGYVARRRRKANTFIVAASTKLSESSVKGSMIRIWHQHSAKECCSASVAAVELIQINGELTGIVTVPKMIKDAACNPCATVGVI